MCYVSETDTLFYSDNSGLYQKNGSAVIQLSDDNAMSLNLYDGKLYYMIPKGGTIFECGNVYCLNLSTMEKELIISADVYSLSVHSDSIFYQTAEMKVLDNGSYMLRLLKASVQRQPAGTDKHGMWAERRKCGEMLRKGICISERNERILFRRRDKNA